MTEPIVPAEGDRQSYMTQQSVPPQKIGKFAASKMIAKASWNLLLKDKEMAFFPVISVVCNMAFAAFLFLVFFWFVLGGNMAALEAWGEDGQALSMVEYLYIFTLYVVSYFITTFFEAGIIAIAHGRINGQNLTFGDGIRVAKEHGGKIFLWSLLSATVGMILRMIAERSRIVGRLVVALLGAAWSILSYFIVPVLLLENLSIPDSLKQSARTIKRSWGETAIVNIGVGLVFGLLILGGFVALLLAFLTQITPLIIVTGIAFILYVIALTVIASTLGTIFKIVLYEYATKGTVPEGFSEALFQNAFRAKK